MGESLQDKENHIQQQTTKQSIQFIQFNQFNNEKKCNQSFHMSPSIAERFRIYGHKVPKLSVGEVAEKAFIEYMVNHPLETLQTIVQQKIVDEVPSKKQELKIRSLSRKINMCMKVLKAIKENGIGEKDRFENELLDLVIKGADIQNGGEKFLTLLEEAYSYFE